VSLHGEAKKELQHGNKIVETYKKLRNPEEGNDTFSETSAQTRATRYQVQEKTTGF
jgi:hypothetical protein